MRHARQDSAGFAVYELPIVLAIAALIVALLLPALSHARRTSRMMQNNTQLRGIVQGFFTFGQGCKSGGADGFYPGVTSRGQALQDFDGIAIDPGTFGQSNAVRGYADTPDDITLAHMNDADTGTGFMQYAFAELLNGDFIPVGSSDYLVNPNDPHKIPFVPGATGDAGRFDLRHVSYTVVNVAIDDLFHEWRETVNADAITLADRAVGNGDTLGRLGSTASSVWTDSGSGEWTGGVARNDASVETVRSFALKGIDLTYGDLVFEDQGSIDNLFAHPDDETLNLNAAGEIERDQGVLFDQDEAGRATGV